MGHAGHRFFNDASGIASLRARVVVGAESRSQVAPVGDRRLADVRVRAVPNSGLELVGPDFYPKNCRLEISLTRPDGPPIRGLRGVVSGVKMAAADPLYAVGVQLSEADVGALAELRGGSAGAPEIAHRSGGPGRARCGQRPGLGLAARRSGTDHRARAAAHRGRRPRPAAGPGPGPRAGGSGDCRSHRSLHGAGHERRLRRSRALRAVSCKS